MSDVEFVTPSDDARTYSMKCSDLYKNGFVMLNGRPCKIVDIEPAEKTVLFRGIDLITNDQLEEDFPVGSIVEVPIVRRGEYQLLDMADGGLLSLLCDTGDLREDVVAPSNELGEEIRAKFDDGRALICTVLEVCGESKVVAIKIAGDD